MVKLTNQTATDQLLEIEPGEVVHLGPNLPNRTEDDDDAPVSQEISNKDYEKLAGRDAFQTLTEPDTAGGIPDIQVQEDV